MNLNNYAPVTNARWVPLKLIKPSPFQARLNMGDMQEMVSSVKERGILVPVKLRPAGKGFELVFGHRRFEASKQAGKTEVPALIEELTDIQAAEEGLAENINRDDFSDFEEAQGMMNLCRLWEDRGQELSKRELARRLSKSVTYVSNCFEVLSLPDDLKAVTQRHKGVKSSVLMVAKAVPDAQDRQPFIAAIEDPKRPASARKIESMVNDYKIRESNRRQSYTPDRSTQRHINLQSQRAKEAERQVKDALNSAESALRQLTSWLPEMEPAAKLKLQPRLAAIKAKVKEL